MPRLHSLAKIDLPREKLKKYGSAKLSDHELLAVILGSGVPGRNVLELSKHVLALMTRLGAAKVTLEHLQIEKGLGQIKSLQILALFALSERWSTAEPTELFSAQDVWKLCLDLRAAKKEHFVAFFLDVRGRVIERQVISIGILDASLVHPREVFEPAIALHAASVIVAHNHPSGNHEPSDADIEVTKQLVAAGTILDIPILEHVILSERGFTSLKKLGIIP